MLLLLVPNRKALFYLEEVNEVGKLKMFVRRLRNRLWDWVRTAAAKRHINPITFMVMYGIGLVVYYIGVVAMLNGNFFLGLAIIGGSYLFDYGYVYVFGRPDWKMNCFAAAYGGLAIYLLSSRVGLFYALAIVVVVAITIFIARKIKGRK